MNEIIVDSAEKLLQLKEFPNGKFILSTSLDLDGELWIPVDFNGIFQGNGHRISNFRIYDTHTAGCQGFFGRLGKDARVTDLQLTHFSVVAGEDARFVGALAGINEGHMENCTVGADAPYVPTPRGNRNALTGYCDNSQIHIPESACAGALVGKNSGSITAAVSYVALLSQHQGLCGENAGTAEGLYRDVSHRTALLPASAVAMRRQIVSHMLTQGNFRWIPVKDMAFTSAYSGSYKIYEKDQVHYGLPYTQKNGCVERAAYCMDTDDHVAAWLPGYSDAAKESRGSAVAPWDVYLGNDCSGAVYWSWQRVCPSIEFGFTGDMVPTPENQKEYGIAPLGDFVCNSVLTNEVIDANTEDKIAQCYTLLQLGDAIVSRDPTYGHTRLVARDPMVMRRADGSLDITASYVPTHEHGVGKGSSGRLSTWQLDARYTFRDLLDTHYVPITNVDLIKGEAAAVTLKSEGITGPFTGSITANYRIISSTVTLTREDGQRFEHVEFTALDKDRYKETPRQDGYARSTVRSVDLSVHQQPMAHLPQGNYRYSVSLLLSTGTTHIIHEGSIVL